MSFTDTMWVVVVNHWAVIIGVSIGLTMIVYAIITAARHEIGHSFACMACGHQWHMTIATMHQLNRRGEMPRCGLCGSDNIVSVIG